MRALAFLRNTWRGLTSMRTALVLLFLLAIAALPGALLPQRSLNAGKVESTSPTTAGGASCSTASEFFDVYGSVWFSAVYLLLFVSLVGCLAPRTFEYATSLRAKPVLTPRNLARLPHHARGETARDPDEVMATARARLRGWRLEVREEDGGARSISAERGYLRETGNLVFHFAMLGLIVALAIGKMFNYEGQVIVLANGSEFCNSGTFAYDSFTPRPARRRHRPRRVLRQGRRLHRALPALRPGRLLPRRPRVPVGRGPDDRHAGSRTRSRSTARCASRATASTCSATATPRCSR